MRVDNRAGKGTSGTGKFGSIADRMNMELGSKFLHTWKLKAQLFKRLQLDCCRWCHPLLKG
jgi:hypothetical protein